MVFDNTELHWLTPSQSYIDIAVTPLHKINQKSIDQVQRRIFLKAIPSNLVLTDEEMSHLSAIEDIVMIGYPTGLRDKFNNFPIIRRGITASHPSIDFNNMLQTVVDIACFPGSSGSPILIFNEGHWSHNRKLYVGNRAILIGVLAQGPQWPAEGQIYAIETAITQLARTQVMIHLGYAVKAKALRDFTTELWSLAEEQRSVSASEINPPADLQNQAGGAGTE